MTRERIPSGPSTDALTPSECSSEGAPTPPTRIFLGKRLPGIDERLLDSSHWPEINAGSLSNEKRRQYLQRREAIQLYLNGAPVETIEHVGGLTAKQISKLIRHRCLETHPDGQIWGWRAIVPHVRVVPYLRQSVVRPGPDGEGAVGALRQVFLRCTAERLEERLAARILKHSSHQHLELIRPERHTIHRWFLQELRRLGFEARNEWPFNVARLGYTSLCRHMNEVLEGAPVAGAVALTGPDARTKLKAGDGTQRPELRVFQRVECDSHKLDGLFAVLIPNPAGGYTERLVRRLWVTVILEVKSRVVLGYWLTLRREVPSEDVLRAIKAALSPWRRREISFSSEAYTEDAALPSGHAPAYVGACWDEFCVDGAMALKCKDVAQALGEVVQASILSPNDSFLARRSKDDRPFIETYFRALGSRSLQHLSNSTMGNPNEKAGRRPDLVAVNSRVQIEYLQEFPPRQNTCRLDRTRLFLTFCS